MGEPGGIGPQILLRSFIAISEKTRVIAISDFYKIKNLAKNLPRKPPNMGPEWASWGLLGGSWSLEAYWKRFGGVLGASWWPTWPQLGPQNGARFDQKSKQK